MTANSMQDTTKPTSIQNDLVEENNNNNTNQHQVQEGEIGQQQPPPQQQEEDLVGEIQTHIRRASAGSNNTDHQPHHLLAGHQQPPQAQKNHHPQPVWDSLYYEAEGMATLNAFSLAALNRLRSYKPPPLSLWDELPVRKRAAVLVLLFADRWGDLRVVITMRAASLRSFSGHAALPGGKADSLEETPYQIARREAYEEIGLPMEDSRIPRPFRIEPLCLLPPALARTHLVVRPCVAFLHADRDRHTSPPGSPPPLVEESMIPRLDAREVAAVFSAPFYNFLKTGDLPPRPGQGALPEGSWYEGAWIEWKGMPWKVHNFYVPVNNQKVSRPRRASEHGNLGENLQEEAEAEAEQDGGRFKVWGMTGRLLIDAARIAFAEEPEQEHNNDLGDTKFIVEALQEGAFEEVGKDGQQANGGQEKQGGGADSHKM